MTFIYHSTSTTTHVTNKSMSSCIAQINSSQQPTDTHQHTDMSHCTTTAQSKFAQAYKFAIRKEQSV